ncbi:1,4-alpha-glucan branching protein GlgB [Fundicoccus sp. Sow4_H7]|uniref:1,4-alpha-glucan branching protein GlgB n=1 Tax=Fundicoccus sp. Sow4_H7 TaxID=3438784 RepID=UPI003F8D9F44
MEHKIQHLNYFTDDIFHFNHGDHTDSYRFLGSKKIEAEGVVIGYQFSVWAPNAHKVYLQGDFNQWRIDPMDFYEGGIWSLFVTGAKKGQCYKYGIDHGNGHIEYKIDPYAFRFEKAPKDASIIWDLEEFNWSDGSWLRRRKTQNFFEKPLQIYEVHATSWRQHPDGSYYTFKELAESLIPYVKEMGYTHIEFMPLMDHPLEASWGYQITGYYAVGARFGTPEELKYFVNEAHKAGIGVFMDWVPGHFNRNANALAYFDGTPTYEYQDVNQANNIGWGTLNFDLGKTQVHSFLISNAIFWLKEFHIDGLRVDAVSNMIYLDFDQGPWTPNEDGTNENYQGVRFLQKMNTSIKKILPDVIIMAEESTSREKITASVEEGGLGFDFKWNMGWMNDTLKFFEMDPYYRPQNLTLITFVFMYQYKERYILPYSHDEVVHGKKSLLGKIPGNRFEQFATLRLIHGYMLAQPGKKLHFMGNELGQYLEWRFYSELEWIDLTRPYNKEYQHFMKTINHFGLETKALYELDHSPDGLTVLDADNYQEGILTFIRRGIKPRDFIIVVCNFVPVQRDSVRVGVPYKGNYQTLLNSDDLEFGGKRKDATDDFKTDAIEYNGQPFSIEISVPGLSVQYIQPKRVYGVNKQGRG